MQQQINKQMTEEKTSSVFDSAKQQFQTTEFFEPQITQVPSVKKKVISIKYKSCCGCGCHYVDAYAVVDENSDWKEGQRMTNWENNMYFSYNDALNVTK